MNTSALHSALLTVSAYKDVLRTPVMSTVLRLLSVLTRGQGEDALSAYTDLFYTLRQEGFDSLGSWLADALRWDEGPYPQLAESGGQDSALETAAQRDLTAFSLLAGMEGLPISACPRRTNGSQTVCPPGTAASPFPLRA